MGGRKPTVRWNENQQRWMAWVRFPDGSRRKVERIDQAQAERDLAELLRQRDEAQLPGARRTRLVTFNEAIDDWLEAGCPDPAPSKRNRHAKVKSENTVENIRYCLDAHVRSRIGTLWVDRTATERVEGVFQDMDDAGYATSTIDHTWSYLNRACLHGQRHGRIERNPVEQTVLPPARPPKPRKSFSLEQFERVLLVAIPQDPRPAMWLTGLMCGLRPGELTGLRWSFTDVDSDDPSIDVSERASEVRKRYVGQAEPKTVRKGRIGLHPMVVAALRRHRQEMQQQGLYEPEGFVFCTRNKTAMSLSNTRRSFQKLCARAGLEGKGWTTYELRHSFVSLVSEHLDDLVKVADLAGHADTRTTQGYRHCVRPSLPHAIHAWDRLLSDKERRVQPKAA